MTDPIERADVLRALKSIHEYEGPDAIDAALEAIAALPAAKQEPAPGYCPRCKDYTIAEPLYAAPPSADREDAEREALAKWCDAEARDSEQAAENHAAMGSYQCQFHEYDAQQFRRVASLLRIDAARKQEKS